MQYLAPILAALGIVCNLFLGLYVFFSNRSAAKDQELQQAKSRLSTLEERVKNMPDHKEISGMEADIRSLQTEVEGLGKTLSSIERTVNRINDYLLNSKGA